MSEPSSGQIGDVRCFAWESQEKHNAEFYCCYVELFSDGWLYAVKLELLCPGVDLKKHANFAKNGQLIAPYNKIIIDAIHVRVVGKNQIEPSTGIFHDWGPLHEASPLIGPWIEGYTRPAVPEPILDLIRVHLPDMEVPGNPQVAEAGEGEPEPARLTLPYEFPGWLL